MSWSMTTSLMDCANCFAIVMIPNPDALGIYTNDLRDRCQLFPNVLLIMAAGFAGLLEIGRNSHIRFSGLASADEKPACYDSPSLYS